MIFFSEKNHQYTKFLALSYTSSLTTQPVLSMLVVLLSPLVSILILPYERIKSHFITVLYNSIYYIEPIIDAQMVFSRSLRCD
jgi:hypothetical protein